MLRHSNTVESLVVERRGAFTCCCCCCRCWLSNKCPALEQLAHRFNIALSAKHFRPVRRLPRASDRYVTESILATCCCIVLVALHLHLNGQDLASEIFEPIPQQSAPPDSSPPLADPCRLDHGPTGASPPAGMAQHLLVGTSGKTCASIVRELGRRAPTCLIGELRPSQRAISNLLHEQSLVGSERERAGGRPPVAGLLWDPLRPRRPRLDWLITFPNRMQHFYFCFIGRNFSAPTKPLGEGAKRRRFLLQPRLLAANN